MKYQIGLDIGASGVKLAVFEGRGPKARLQRFEQFDSSDEGFLTEDELYRGIREFLDEKVKGGAGLCMGVPQYLVTTSVADYPAAKGGDLDRMVALDASQVGGLSDASFVHGYVRMQPGNGRKCPVLVALCREDGVCEQLSKMGEAGLECEVFSPSGLALANAAFALCKGLKETAEPALILDIGRDNTLVAAVAGGQVLYISTLMFSASKFEDAAQATLEHRHVGKSVGSPKEFLESVRLDEESSQSFFRQAAGTLESEIQNAVEHWRSQENELVANMPITHVYVTGGGSRLGGLAAWLKSILECDVDTFGPEVAGERRPELTVAYGLGLQAAGQASLPVTLVPERILDERLRHRRWPLLAVAAGILFLTVFAGLISHRISNAMAVEELAARKKKLSECLEVAHRIKGAGDQTAALERKLASLAVIANRSGRIVQAVRRLADAPVDNAWLIYLGNDLRPDGKEEFFSNQSTGSTAGNFIQTASAARLETLDYKASARDGEFICAGYAPDNHRDEVAALMAFLDDKASKDRIFHGVDRADSISDSASQLVWTWREFLNDNEQRLSLGLPAAGRPGGSFMDRFELFTLRLPFAKPDVNLDAAEDGKDDE